MSATSTLHNKHIIDGLGAEMLLKVGGLLNEQGNLKKYEKFRSLDTARQGIVLLHSVAPCYVQEVAGRLSHGDAGPADTPCLTDKTRNPGADADYELDTDGKSVLRSVIGKLLPAQEDCVEASCDIEGLARQMA